MIFKLLILTFGLIASAQNQETKKNETIKLVLSQGFFNDLTADFLAPTFNSLKNVTIPDQINNSVDFEGFIVDFNITKISISEA
jgi:hypothetical protein